jgi:hypothetical protein
VTIKLQFSTSTEASSALICRISHSPFSHVDVVLPDTDAHPGALLGASNSPAALVLEGNPNGVAIRPPNYQPFKVKNIAVLESTPDVEAKFYANLRSQLGEPFDEKALHAFLDGRPFTGRDWRDADAWFCSELVAWSLEEAGFFPWTIVVSKDRINPPDLLLLTNWALLNATSFWFDT